MSLIKQIRESVRNFLMEKKNGDYSYGCVMLGIKVPKEKWDMYQDFIDDEDVYEGDKFGREDDPHITLLYGLHDTVQDDEVSDLVKKWTPVEVKLSKVGMFESSEYDVIKFEFNNKELKKYNKQLVDNVEFTTSYPDYHAHMTIAYVKSGKGKAICDKINKELKDDSYVGDNVIYSKSDKTKEKFKIE